MIVCVWVCVVLKCRFMCLLSQIAEHEELIAAAPIVVMDANLRVETMRTLLEMCRSFDVPGEYI